MKLVILVDSVFSERDYIRFGIENIAEKGIEVCLWDFIKIRENSLNIDGFVDSSYKVSRRIFNNIRDIDQAIPELKELFLIDYRSGTYNLYDRKWFQKLGAKIIMLDQGLQPASYWNPTMAEYIDIFRHQIVSDGISRSFRKALKFFRLRLLKDKDDYLFASRKLTIPSFVATIVTTWYGAILEVGRFTFYNGIVTWIIFCLFYYISAIIFAFFIGPKIHSNNIRSIPHIFHKRLNIYSAYISSILIYLIGSPIPYIMILSTIISHIYDIEIMFLGKNGSDFFCKH